jgi:hypothetical protein
MGGRPGLTKEEKELDKFSKERYARYLEEIMHLTPGEIAEIAKSNNVPMIKRCIARILQQSEKHGDASRLESLLNRAIGKVADKVEHSGLQEPRVVVTLPSNGREAKD